MSENRAHHRTLGSRYRVGNSLAAPLKKAVRSLVAVLKRGVRRQSSGTKPCDRNILEEMPVAWFLADASAGKYLDASAEALDLLGYSLDLLRRLRYADLLAEPHPGWAQAHTILLPGESLRDEQTLRRRDGRVFRTEVVVRRLSDGRLLLLIAEGTPRDRPETPPTTVQRSGSSLGRNLPGIFYSFSEDGKLLKWNRNLEVITGYSADEIAGSELLAFFPIRLRPILRHKLRKAFEHGHIEGEASLVAKTGRQIPFHFNAVKARLGGQVCLVGMGIDLSERKRSEERIQFLAFHDTLTQLPNRAVLDDRLNRTLAYARRHGSRFAVLFLDVDGFKQINDRFGHPAGDQVLRESAQRIRQSLRHSDSVGRFGGDEFLVLLPVIADKQEPEVVAEKILVAFARPIRIDIAGGAEFIRVSTSIGIALYPVHGRTIQELIGAADRALYLAKKAGKNGYRIADTVPR